MALKRNTALVSYQNPKSREPTNEPIPWSRVLLKKLTTGPQLVKKFPAFYGIRKFTTAFTAACSLFLS
jgi:hypothetical protein